MAISSLDLAEQICCYIEDISSICVKINNEGIETYKVLYRSTNQHVQNNCGALTELVSCQNLVFLRFLWGHKWVPGKGKALTRWCARSPIFIRLFPSSSNNQRVKKTAFRILFSFPDS